MTEKNVNYPPAMTLKIVAAYKKGKTEEEREDILETLSIQHGKGVKSLRAKLVREGVYIKKEYKTKAGDKPETKENIVKGLASLLGVAAKELAGLDKATKKTLDLLRNCIEAERRETDK